jgi:hypothetical protein
MTRRGLLAMLGLGQWSGSSHSSGVPMCFGWVDGQMTQIECPCDEGAERCPLGHCQNPHWPVWELRTSDNEIVADRTIWVTPYTPRVCSTCGIVYVKVAS